MGAPQIIVAILLLAAIAAEGHRTYCAISDARFMGVRINPTRILPAVGGLALNVLMGLLLIWGGFWS